MTSHRFLLLVLLTVTAVGAVAQPAPSVSLTASPSLSTLPAPRGEEQETVLYDQTDNPSDESFPSQEFELSSSAANSQGADDFVVPTDSAWSITEITAIGRYRPDVAPAEFVDVYFYTDEDGAPGSRITKYDDLPIESDDEGTLTLLLSPSMILTEGVYWVSVVVDMDADGVGRQWFWTTQATVVPIGAELHWRNPGNDFNTGCTSWQPLNTVCGDDGGFDASFRLVGRAAESFVGFAPQRVAGALDVEETGTETVPIFNDTDQPVTYEFDLIGAASFITGVSPVRGGIPAESTVDVEVALSAAGLRPGVYADTLMMASIIGNAEVMYTLPVELAVTAFVGLEGGTLSGPLVLGRNYPNPFSSETTIELTLLDPSPVTVEVYDTLGRRVAVLVDEEQVVGQRLLTWDARGAPSGVYVVRARTETDTVVLPVALVR